MSVVCDLVPNRGRLFPSTVGAMRRDAQRYGQMLSAALVCLLSGRCKEIKTE